MILFRVCRKRKALVFGQVPLKPRLADMERTLLPKGLQSQAAFSEAAQYSAGLAWSSQERTLHRLVLAGTVSHLQAAWHRLTSSSCLPMLCAASA